VQNIVDLRPLHRRALDDAGRLLARVGPTDLDRRTPCAGWDLRALLAHLIGQNHGFAAAVAGQDAPREAFAPRDPPPDAVAAAWRDSADLLTAAFAAAPLDREVLLVEISTDRRVPVAAAVGFQLLDTVVHTWDVATSLGESYRPDDELVAATLAQARRIPDGPAREGPRAAFGPSRPVLGEDGWRDALALVGRA
jgi:uncharacterized protein (TIGR03086 family)